MVSKSSFVHSLVEMSSAEIALTKRRRPQIFKRLGALAATLEGATASGIAEWGKKKKRKEKG